ncbi:hypothetical protein UA08_06820 [Talaromyces atroroseus]|uniref:Uncharacterized protein n=1 Tax=Talaromyces atroroseus TaxID=1441469 RepID=A0A225AL26_TALAT|nr:hypothetical protein UA08_06820 [Talaromyces atroroseus]OKL57948.1 hypothetical protein UA08_06820 [Talaromyces atroroseus]
MPGVTGEPAGLTRQCSHSNDLSTLSPSSAPSGHKPFSFMRSSSFSFNKSHSHAEPPTIPECEKEPIFDEIRDCDEAPYPQTPQPRKSPTTGALDIKHKPEYKNFNNTANNNRSLSTSLPSVVPSNPPSSQSSTSPMPIPPHRNKWLNKLDPRFNAKLMEERQKTIERQERERRKKREDDQMIEDLLSKWAN